MVLVVSAVLVMVLTAGVAKAQQAPVKVNNWVIGGDFAPAGLVKTDGLIQPIGSIHSSSGDKIVGDDAKANSFVQAFIGRKPVNGFGGEVRFYRFGSSNDLNSSVAQTDGQIKTWGPDATPKIVSSAPVLYGPVGYSQKSSAKVTRFDALLNYTVGLSEGTFSFFAGVPVLRVESSEDLARSQNFLLYTLNSDRSISAQAIREDYNYSSMATAKSTHFGLTGGIEGEYCLFSRLSIDGRLAVATFPWGSGTKADGLFKATKDIYLTASSGGVNGTPTQTLAHLNWAPTAMPYAETVKKTTTAIDMKVGLKLRVRVSNSVLNIGLSVARSSLSNAPTAPGYVISDPYAVGRGVFKPRTTNMSVWSPMLSVGIWF